MTLHPALAPGRAAVVTGAAGGIGLAAAKKFASLGMKVLLADVNEDELARAHADVLALAKGNNAAIRSILADVGVIADVERMKADAFRAFGEVAVLMNNAGIGNGGGPFENYDRWRAVLDTNLWGVINGVQTFAPAMLAQGTDCAIVNTGSKQGITCPPGDTAYNVSKAGVKVLTEGLAHSLRNAPGSKVTAHLLVPGFTYTGIGASRPTAKPPGAWTAEQVIEMLVERMSAGDFYIVCPDNEVTRELDNKRMRWAMDDIVLNRPPLSRWHPDFKDQFEAYLKT